MTTASISQGSEALTPALHARRAEWLGRVTTLVEQVAQWSREVGWKVEVGQQPLDERLLGAYDAPAARISLPPGDLPERAVLIVPVGLHIVGGDGRVDIEGYPTLNRVKLIGVPGGWTIMTDSNVPLRVPWNAETFHQLARDLVS